MRQTESAPAELGAVPIAAIQIDARSRDDIPAVLLGLQHIHTSESLREKVFARLESQASPRVRRDTGRPGMDRWRSLCPALLAPACEPRPPGQGALQPGAAPEDPDGAADGGSSSAVRASHRANRGHAGGGAGRRSGVAGGVHRLCTYADGLGAASGAGRMQFRPGVPLAGESGPARRDARRVRPAAQGQIVHSGGRARVAGMVQTGPPAASGGGVGDQSPGAMRSGPGAGSRRARL